MLDLEIWLHEMDPRNARHSRAIHNMRGSGAVSLMMEAMVLDQT